MLLQHGADPNIRNTDGKTALDLADPTSKAVLTGKTVYNLKVNLLLITEYIFIQRNSLQATEMF